MVAFFYYSFQFQINLEKAVGGGVGRVLTRHVGLKLDLQGG